MPALAILAALLAAAPAPPDADAITVTGRRVAPEEARRDAAAFVRATGVAAGETPAARWIDPVCPRVIGIPPGPAGVVETTMRAVAKEAGAPLAAAPCRANIAVVFTADAGGLARRIAARQPRRFAELPPAARAALFDGAAPIRWWHASEVRGRDGRPAQPLTPPAVRVECVGCTGELPGNDGAPVLAQYGSSLVSTQAMRALTGATVLVDVRRAEGARLEAVAAYAALVALAEIAPNASPAGSVLSLFAAAADPPAGLTARDRDLLRALYALPLDRLARQQRARLARDLAADAGAP